MFDNIRAISDIQRINNGQTVPLSNSQIICCIINLNDAKKNLPDAIYKKVQDLYNEFSKDKKKCMTDLSSYMQRCDSMISEFEKIAPYVLYNGEDNISSQNIRAKAIDQCNHKALRISEILAANFKYLGNTGDIQRINEFTLPLFFVFSISYVMFLLPMLHKFKSLSYFIMDKACKDFSDMIFDTIKNEYPSLGIDKLFLSAHETMLYEHKIACQKCNNIDEYIDYFTRSYARHSGIDTNTQNLNTVVGIMKSAIKNIMNCN